MVAVVPYSCEIQQPIRATAVLGKRPHTHWAARLDREQGSARGMHPDGLRCNVTLLRDEDARVLLRNPAVCRYQGGALRTPRPGSRAGLSLGEARPARAGPPAGSRRSRAVTGRQPRGCAVPSLSPLIVQLAATASRATLPGCRMRLATPTLDPTSAPLASGAIDQDPLRDPSGPPKPATHRHE
jgi:hypothetical protein